MKWQYMISLLFPKQYLLKHIGKQVIILHVNYLLCVLKKQNSINRIVNFHKENTIKKLKIRCEVYNHHKINDSVKI